MSIFAWCTIVGCAVLIIGILFDGPLDDLLPDGLVPVLAVALAVFGAGGMAIESLVGQQVAAALLWGVPGALALGAGATTRATWRRARRSLPLNTAPLTPEELVGEKVSVLWWKDGCGEVRAFARGNQLTIAAQCPEPLRTGQSAWVTDTDDGVLILTPWESSLGTAPKQVASS